MSSLKTILMCRPTFFQIRYSINPWMDLKNPVDVEKAQEQWSALKLKIEKAGAKVKVMEPTGGEQYPDLVFAANAATVRGKKAYLSNLFHPERQGERYFYDKWFSENGFDTTGSLDIPFEGAGDALWAGPNRNKLICAVGLRTDIRVLQQLSVHLRDDNAPFKTYGVRLIDPRFYHIDACFCPLNEKLAFYYPHSLDEISRHNLKNEMELIPVNHQDAAKFACNAVVVGNTVIMNQGPTQIVKDLESVGFKIDFVDMSEFIKSGGSAKCCTLEIS